MFVCIFPWSSVYKLFFYSSTPLLKCCDEVCGVFSGKWCRAGDQSLSLLYQDSWGALFLRPWLAVTSQWTCENEFANTMTSMQKNQVVSLLKFQCALLSTIVTSDLCLIPGYSRTLSLRTELERQRPLPRPPPTHRGWCCVWNLWPLSEAKEGAGTVVFILTRVTTLFPTSTALSTETPRRQWDECLHRLLLKNKNKKTTTISARSRAGERLIPRALLTPRRQIKTQTSTALQPRVHPQTVCVHPFWYPHTFIETPPPPGSYTGLEVSWKSAEGVIVIADHLRPCSKDWDCGMYLKEL